VAIAKQGNKEAFDELARRYWKKVFTVCRRLVNNHEDAEDMTQEVFIKVFSNLPQFDPNRGSFQKWLFRIAKNHCLDYLRGRGYREWANQISLDESYEDEEGNQTTLLDTLIDTTSLSPEELAEREEIRRAVEECLAGMKPDDKALLLKALLLFVYCWGETFHEVARRFGWTNAQSTEKEKNTAYNRAKTRVKKALTQLESCLSKKGLPVKSEDIISIFRENNVE
jgi:RNA polymerase sigma factor (sigma-70 family)